jgi:hypothetical protein
MQSAIIRPVFPVCTGFAKVKTGSLGQPFGDFLWPADAWALCLLPWTRKLPRQIDAAVPLDGHSVAAKIVGIASPFYTITIFTRL